MFAKLLHALDDVTGLKRVRFTSPHPKDMREDVIRAHAELPALWREAASRISGGRGNIARPNSVSPLPSLA